MANTFRVDINGLRALAVIAVVLYHFGLPGITGGFIGVDVFFVISGYLMTQIIIGKLRNDRFILLDFYAARARRIIPALAALVTIMLAFGYFYLSPLDYKVLGKHAIASLSFTSNFIYWSEIDYFDTASHMKWLLHTWSLAVEWQFYILYPVLLIALYWIKSGRFLLRALWLLFIVSLGVSVGQSVYDNSGAFYLLPARGWEFLAGALVYLHPHQYGARLRKWPIGEVLIIVSIIWYSADFNYPGAWPLLPVFGAAMIISVNSTSLVLSNKIMQFLGTISYSLYLWHWPIFVGARYFQFELNVITLLVMFILSVALAYFSYFFVEARFRKSSPTVTQFSYVVRYIVALVIVTIPAGAIWASQGMRDRSSGEVKQKIIANQSRLSDWQYPAECKFVDKFCEIGIARPVKALFWGDSHIQQWHPLFRFLDKANKTNSTQIIIGGSAGCPPIRDLERIKNGFDCQQANDRTFQRARQEDIKIVVLGSIWSTYFSDDIFSGNRQPNICDAATGCGIFNSPQQAAEKARIYLLRDVKALIQQGKNVYLLLPIPIYHDAVPNLMAKGLFLDGEGRLTKSAKQHNADSALVREMIVSVAQQTGAQVLNPAEVLCGSGECTNNQNGISIYKDSNHLVSEATLWFEPMFTRIFLLTLRS